MNIFNLHEDTKKSAQMHCDKHVVKMIIEYAQLMSTAHRILDGEFYYGKTARGHKIQRWKHPNENIENTLYKASHINHPSAIWVRESIANYNWLYDLFTNLCDEYTHRYGKVHSCQHTIEHAKMIFPDWLPQPKSFTRAMPDEFKYDTSIDTFSAYKNYIRSKPWVASNYLRDPSRKPNWL